MPQSLNLSLKSSVPIPQEQNSEQPGPVNCRKYRKSQYEKEYRGGKRRLATKIVMRTGTLC